MPLVLYHGSKSGLTGPIQLTGRNRHACDFGQGFYLGDTPSQPQTLICSGERPTMYKMSLDLDGLKIHRFEPDENWALFVAFNRGRLEKFRKFPFYRRFAAIRRDNDVIYGKIANDRMFGVITNFFDGLIGIDALVKALGALNIGNQYCALTPKAFAAIKILEERRLSAVECENLRRRHERQLGFALAEADRICRTLRGAGPGFDEILERLSKEEA